MINESYYYVLTKLLLSFFLFILILYTILGLENLTLDIEFMLNIKTSVFWRFCWGLITPLIMGVVFIYALISFEAVTFGDDYVYPVPAIGMYLFLFRATLY